ncbi:7TM GPCR Srw domain containing protein [Trichuris trichiura]|uniref:7TM GPCR Srw domain containing protein n=1 Tax=Trichuris trichiura TaxID=36087 RepID=A0A077YWM8_TRITR|nr:7TM GPCR Srw domain containing protein [Trichuris trichiura]
MREISQAEHPWLYKFVHVSLKLVPNISTTIPLLVLIVLNALLLHSLSKWRREYSKMLASPNNQRSPEIRVALMVAITIASFLLFQTPSGILYLWDAINGSRNRLDWFYTATYASNLLVIIGKTLNFIIYCSSSKNFRKQLLLLLVRSDDATKRQYFYAKYLGIEQTTKLFPRNACHRREKKIWDS